MTAEVQETFDWLHESADVVEGVILDTETEHPFVLEEIAPRVVTTKKGDKRKILSLKWLAEDLHMKFKMDLWINNYEIVKPETPELESDNVKLSRRLGYSPVLGGKFQMADFLKLGMRMTAKLAERPGKDKTGADRIYHEIDVSTIVCDGAGAGTQTTLPAISDADAAEIAALAKGCKTQNELSEKINKLGAKNPVKFALHQPALQLIESGKLKFPVK